jgi:hypothetical protein
LPNIIFNLESTKLAFYKVDYNPEHANVAGGKKTKGTTAPFVFESLLN